MFYSSLVAFAVLSAGGALAADATTLATDAIQTGSFFDGLSGLGAKNVDAPSKTSTDNFINFCEGQTLTNGLQIINGSCNGIVMGNIPSKANMVSVIIVQPTPGQQIPSGQDFTIIVQTKNIDIGSFTNADVTYYAAPQDLNDQGSVIGHIHVAIQSLGAGLNPSQPPDAAEFAFFKGVDDSGDGQGSVNVTVTGGLSPGFYRVCTLTSSSNHQPVLMPVAQRGPQDDCTKFSVTGNNQVLNAKANNGADGINAAALAQSAVEAGPGALTTPASQSVGTAAATTSSAASTTTSSSAAATSISDAAVPTRPVQQDNQQAVPSKNANHVGTPSNRKGGRPKGKVHQVEKGEKEATKTSGPRRCA